MPVNGKQRGEHAVLDRCIAVGTSVNSEVMGISFVDDKLLAIFKCVQVNMRRRGLKVDKLLRHLLQIDFHNHSAAALRQFHREIWNHHVHSRVHGSQRLQVAIVVIQRDRWQCGCSRRLNGGRDCY